MSRFIIDKIVIPVAGITIGGLCGYIVMDNISNTNSNTRKIMKDMEKLKGDMSEIGRDRKKKALEIQDAYKKWWDEGNPGPNYVYRTTGDMPPAHTVDNYCKRMEDSDFTLEKNVSILNTCYSALSDLWEYPRKDK